MTMLVLLLAVVVNCEAKPAKKRYALGVTKERKHTNKLVKTYPKTNPKEIKVMLTAYWVGEDKWTSKLQSATGVRLDDGHCAVDPRIISYGSTLVVAGRKLKAVDTGSAVISKKASRGRYPVIDVFFHSKREAIAWLNKTPSITTATIL